MSSQVSTCSRDIGTYLTLEGPHVLVYCSLMFVQMTLLISCIGTFATFEIFSILVDDLDMSWKITFSTSAVGTLVTLIRLLHYHCFSWSCCSPRKSRNLSCVEMREETKQAAEAAGRNRGCQIL